ncbi:uncharacterized protein LOC143622457 [Bidens hawaiensis]|uniref:uncharacterized protein LOC143622457 n=1 Tax=Bidens hawaiensis TaxID=980011 RepID=UPI00404B52ED
MPDLRRGVRQSKRTVNVNNNNDDNVVVAPAPRRGGRRGKAQAPKAPMPRPAGRGRGRAIVNQDNNNINNNNNNNNINNVGFFGGRAPQLNLDVALRDQLVVGRGENLVANDEEEGSTSPVPERVQVGNSPAYKLERKLGKGGFGQVYVGRRVTGGSGITGPDAIEVALKLEHRNGKGCNYNPPYFFFFERQI